MTSQHRPTRLLCRGLLLLVPQALRDEYGADMVQLTIDRRTHSAEPAWRLWPALVCDTAVVVASTRSEQLVIPYRALVLGLALAIAAFAVLSGDPLFGAAIAGAAGIVALALFARRRSSSTSDRPDAGSRTAWVPWAVGGALLSAGALVVVAASGDQQLSAAAWMAVMGTLLFGMTALATGLVLAAQRAVR